MFQNLHPRNLKFIVPKFKGARSYSLLDRSLHTDRQIEIQSYEQTDRHTDIQRGKHVDIQTDREISRQTNILTGRHTCKKMYRHGYIDSIDADLDYIWYFVGSATPSSTSHKHFCLTQTLNTLQRSAQRV